MPQDRLLRKAARWRRADHPGDGYAVLTFWSARRIIGDSPVPPKGLGLLLTAYGRVS
jgi:hypothetical protein